MAGGIAGGGIDDFGRAIGKGALHWGAIGHAARRIGVEGGFTLGGGAVGYAATGTMDGALMGASMGQAIGGAFGNFAVACFTAGTPLVVDMEGNSRPIDEIEVGDFVLARSEFDPDGPLELKRVEEKFVRTAVVMELVVHGQSIKTTAEHPFYVPLQGRFVAAGALQVGEQLVGHDGKLVEIESIGSTGEVTTVYNLRVADFHTYFVGGGLWGFDVWVHNQYNSTKDGPLSFVSENLGTPRNVAQRAARDYESQTIGAFSDVAARKRSVPALQFNNPNKNGANVVKFDGFNQLDNGVIELIDAKTRIVPFSTRQGPFISPSVRDGLIRKSLVIEQNPGFNAVLEFPTSVARREAQQVLRHLGITNISTRVR